MDVALNPGDHFVDADGNVWVDALICAGGITGMVLLVATAPAGGVTVGVAIQPFFLNFIGYYKKTFQDSESWNI